MGRNTGWHDPVPNDKRYWQHYYKPLGGSKTLISLCGNHYVEEGTKLKYNKHKKLCKKCQNHRGKNESRKKRGDWGRRFPTSETKEKSMFGFSIPKPVINHPKSKPEIIVGFE